MRETRTHQQCISNSKLWPNRSVLLLAISFVPILAAARDRTLGVDKGPFRPTKIPNSANYRNPPHAPPPPPPPPPPNFPIETSMQEFPVTISQIPTLSDNTSINPIHYNFPVKPSTDPVEISQRDSSDQRSKDIPSRRLYPTEFTSARQDAVTRFSSTPWGKVKLTASSTLIGSILGSFIGKSITGHAMPLSSVFAMLFLCSNFFRNDYGELSRSLGLALIYMLSRIRRVRQRYPTGPNRILSAMGIRDRIPFPPQSPEDENPWSYQPQSRIDPDFDMIKSMIAVAVIGSFCGGNVPLIPTWIGSAAGALTLVYVCTTKTGRGDLTRIMGMRVVALVLEALDINRELRISRKSGIVAGKVFDKVMILDRKHRIKDRLVQVLNWVYEKAVSTASQVQQDASQRKSVSV